MFLNIVLVYMFFSIFTSFIIYVIRKIEGKHGHGYEFHYCAWLWNNFYDMKHSLRVSDKGDLIYFLCRHLFRLMLYIAFYLCGGIIHAIALSGDLITGALAIKRIKIPSYRYKLTEAPEGMSAEEIAKRFPGMGR